MNKFEQSATKWGFTADFAMPDSPARLIKGRPIMTREQLLALGQQILRKSTLDAVDVIIQHTAQFVTRLANGQVFSSNDGDLVRVSVVTTMNGPPAVGLHTNQVSEELLLASLRLCEEIQRALPTYITDTGQRHDPPVQDIPIPVNLWYETTVEAISMVRDTVVPSILQEVRRAGFEAAGFIGLMARSEATVRKDGNLVFAHEETDAEVNVVARDSAAKSTGWGGAVARDWTKLNYRQATEHAIEMASLGRNPVAVEPGRRTAIFTSAALAPMLAYFSVEFDGGQTKGGYTALSKSRYGGIKWGERVFDSRLRINSDPSDPEGGYRPWDLDGGFATPPMTWINDGILKNLAFGVLDAMSLGKQYAQSPFSFRVSGGNRTIPEMIASCKEGILVNRTTNVNMIDESTCLLTGATQGGCFLIKDGKINRPVKNFRFVESPFFFLNRIDALGRPERATFGSISDGDTAWLGDWPRPPVIVPPIMVRDFNFSQLADAI